MGTRRAHYRKNPRTGAVTPVREARIKDARISRSKNTRPQPQEHRDLGNEKDDLQVFGTPQRLFDSPSSIDEKWKAFDFFMTLSLCPKETQRCAGSWEGAMESSTIYTIEKGGLSIESIKKNLTILANKYNQDGMVLVDFDSKGEGRHVEFDVREVDFEEACELAKLAGIENFTLTKESLIVLDDGGDDDTSEKIDKLTDFLPEPKTQAANIIFVPNTLTEEVQAENDEKQKQEFEDRGLLKNNSPPKMLDYIKKWIGKF